MDTIKFSHEKKPLMVAHRGCSYLERENTASAFVAAGNRSYFGIETDVHRTADGRYICIHDDSTGRVACDDLPVEQTDFDTLRSYTYTHGTDFWSYPDLRIATLDEFLDESYLKQHTSGTLMIGRNAEKVCSLEVFASMRVSAKESIVFDMEQENIRRYIHDHAAVLTVEKEDRILGLSTCTEANSMTRVVVFCYLTE